MNRKGQMHIEMIISMIIFVGFTAAIFIIINPLERTTPDVGITEVVKTNVIENMRVSLTRTGILINDSINCAYIKLNPDEFIEITNSSGTIVSSRKYGGKTYIRGGGKGFFIVYNSEEFKDHPGFDILAGCYESTNYTISASQKIPAISNKKILTMNSTYWNSYDDSKERFGVPISEDYGIIIENSLGKEIVRALRTQTTPTRVGVKESNELMVYEDGSMEYVNVKVLTY
ncbi:hypothetical protein COU61_01675 [Candidatus Pacearchaeota archaeon CG10_big_fil_rev_8_21_14_0_10_35_13]|nr:MAG: hypothetical protein COU61_01675 [Candidatus Pacearchaeota archaeon CG10_big_fil_rev_8_21_14_0_10_35_13]